MDPVTLAALSTMFVTASLCAALSFIAYWKNILTWDGAVAAFGVGSVIGLFGHITWLFLLLIFLISSFAATKYRFALKEEMGFQEGKRGERKAANVLANGLIPTLIAFISFFDLPFLAGIDKKVWGILFITAISVAASDTLASEIGILSQKVVLITTGKPVKPGVDGGISFLGEGWAFIGALYSSAASWFFFYFVPELQFDFKLIWIPVLFGFLGCQVDSVFGATLERRGYMTKLTNNLSSIAICTLVAFLVYLVVYL